MVSVIRRQRHNKLKQQSEQGHHQPCGAEPKSLHLLLTELANDEKVLKGFNRIDDKLRHKREVLVPKYRAAVEEYLASEARFDNPLFAIMVVWLFDIEDLDTAINWCGQAIERELDTPQRFKRDFATFCADEVLKWCERMSAQGHSIEPFFSQVFAMVREEWRINEQLTAKWYKFAGLHLLRDENGKAKASSVGDIETLEQAKALLIEAQNQSPKAQVNTHLDKIEQRMRALIDGTNL
ncbi:phage terminase small subunit [Psychromonas ossibalaenae]|uniref:phage terminase small subunit n=1 Tax=Psychromonas ossibalaenae TaxID=444922 RepID=UPI00037ACD9B|nr:phage terminase small subunit [Psychromonas ossibalaenae]